MCVCVCGGGGGSKQLKIPPGGGFRRGCNISYIFLGGGGGSGQPGNPMATPLIHPSQLPYSASK